MTEPTTWTPEQRDQMRARRTAALEEFRSSPKACQLLQIIAHRGTLPALFEAIRMGHSSSCANALITRITVAAADIVLTQLVENDPNGMAYQLTDQAVTEEASNWNAEQRRGKQRTDLAESAAKTDSESF